MTQAGATIEWAEHHLRIINTLNCATLAITFFQQIEPLKDALLESLSRERQSNAELDTELAKLEANVEGVSITDSAEFFLEFLIEVVVTRSVDHFEQYLSDICVRVFRTHPKRLGSMTITVEKLLEVGNIDKALEVIIEQKVRNLLGEGFPKVLSFLQSEVGLNIDIESASYQNAIKLLELRNLIVHNARRVDRRFLNKTKESSVEIGEVYPLDKRSVSDLIKSLRNVGDTIDRAIIEKFDL